MTNIYHESVLVKEVVESLHVKKDSKIIDCTLGTGGHTLALIEAGAKVLGLEADPKMLEIAKSRLEGKANLIIGNFSNLEKIAIKSNFIEVDGILFDLGVSNLHLKDDERGFSFNSPDQLLDMRLNTEIQGVKASDLLNVLDQTQLTTLFEKVLSHNESKRIAGRIISARPINTVGELIEVLKDIPHKEKLNPATLPMLALRIAVNEEYNNLEEVIPQAIKLLKNGGRLSIIVFHSGEEKIVQKLLGRNLKIRIPGNEEINKNIRSRSAKLYTYVKN